MTQWAAEMQVDQIDLNAEANHAEANHAETNGEQHRRLLRQAVAKLTNEAIHSMSSRELLFAIRSAGAMLPQGDHRQLRFADRPTLERLVFLSRRACRNRDSRVSSFPKTHGKASSRFGVGGSAVSTIRSSENFSDSTAAVPALPR